MTYRPLFLAAIAAWIVTSPANAGVIYSSDFESNTGGFVVAGTTYDASNRATLPTLVGTNTSTFLGRIATGSATLNLSGLTPGTTYTLAFDLFIGGSWDGNATSFGPDVFTVTANSTTLLRSTFTNIDSNTQSYSDTNIIGFDPANPSGAQTNSRGTGADQKNFDVPPAIDPGIYDLAAIYYFSGNHSIPGNPVITFTTSSTSLVLTFSASNLEGDNINGGPNEFWALDNVKITSPDAQVVPVPGNLVMLGSVALVGFVGRTVRRIRKS